MVTRILLAAVVISTTARADPPETYDVALVTGDSAAGIVEMTELFGKVCVDSFPDDASVAKEAVARGGIALTQAEVTAILHADQGVGWRIVGKTTTFYLTVEAAPWHACAIRGATRDGFEDMTVFNALRTKVEGGWTGVTHYPEMSNIQGPLQSVANVDAWRMPDGKTETLMVFKTRVADPTLAMGHAGVEVRFVRQQVTSPAGVI